MRLIFCICASMLSMGLFAQDGATPFDQLVRNVDAVVTTAAPHQIFDTPEAKSLSEAIRVDIATNQAGSTIRLLLQHQDTNPSWQVAVEAVWNSYARSAPTPKDVTTLESLFRATVKAGDHWLNYSNPRGWSDPYSFRRKLAKLILHARAGVPHEIKEDVLLRDEPSRWLSQLDLTPKESTAQAAPIETRTVSLPSVQPQALKKASSASPTSTPSQGPTYPTSWSIIVVLIMAAPGMLWWLRKRSV